MTAPEINLARTLIERYNLRPPIDVEGLAKRYARVEAIKFPIDIDGVCLNLKGPRKKPAILVNSDKPLRRRRFTLAHELGHVLIPWHTGTIVDDLGDLTEEGDGDYWTLESEANRFASELLMPSDWIADVVKKNENPPAVLAAIVDTAEVSMNAAIIRLIGALPQGYVYCLVNSKGKVTSSGRSFGTLSNSPERDSRIEASRVFPMADKMWQVPQAGGKYIWWRFPQEAALPKAKDHRPWREIFEEITADLRSDTDGIEKFRQSVNGVIAFANGHTKARTAEAIYSSVMQRLQSKANEDHAFRSLIEHKKFSSFVVRRIEELLGGG